MSMTEEVFAAIKARADAATPGPFRAFCRALVFNDGFYESLWDEDRKEVICAIPHGKNDRADAEFFAHAREDVPALLAEVERLRAGNEALKNLALKLVKSSSALLEKFTRKEQSAINDVVLFYDQMRDKLRAREDWLIKRIMKTEDERFLCPMPEGYKCESRVGVLCELESLKDREQCWRKAADMATRENTGNSGDFPDNQGEGNVK